ncbi:SETMR methyltransferase, partial [Acromyrmex heyeri]
QKIQKTSSDRAVIKHLHMKSLTPKEIKAELDNVHSTSAPAFATVYNWMNEFKHDRTSTCDARPRSGHPIEAATPEIIDKVHDIVLTDRRVKVRELVEVTGISHGTVISILNETWIHYFTPEMKEQSKQWTSPSKPAPKKAKIDYLPSKQTINDDYYAALLDRFNNILKYLVKKKVLFHQDNARVHSCPAPMAKFNEFRYELFPHPAYSPDLTPYYFLFPNLKK